MCSARVCPPLSRPSSTLTSYLAPAKKIGDNSSSFPCFPKKNQDKRNTQLKGKVHSIPKKQTVPLSYTTTNLCPTPQHNLSITTHHPRTCLHILPYARAQDNVCRQQDPPQSTENEKEGRLEVTFPTKTNDF